MSLYFGTDGVRGRAGVGKLSDDNIAALGRAIATEAGDGSLVVIGRDTRESGSNIFGILTEQLMSGGVDVLDIGVMPTPATARVTARSDAALGVMITASHNPWHDNGVKIFGPDGRKLPNAIQDRLEAAILADKPSSSARQGKLRHEDLTQDYLDHLVRAAEGADLSDLHVAVDAANGAAHTVLPAVLERLGATVTAIGVDPDGRNINDGCGSNVPDALSALVVESGADAGVAVDGDADRIILVDRTGRVADGDQIMGRLAVSMQADGTLTGDSVVATVMSNLGLERHVESLGLRFERTAVGDRHVAARMREIGANLGGEASGHIMLTDHATTGDGTLSAVLVLASLARSGRPSDEVFQSFDVVPQTLVNVRYAGESPLASASVQQALAEADASIEGQGRVLVRASGTEPKIRIMVEGDDAQVVTATAEKLRSVIASAAEN